MNKWYGSRANRKGVGFNRIDSKLPQILLLDVSWAKISERYFEKSRSWLYHKMDGMNNGKPDDFNEAEKETLRNALFDLSKRIHKCAESI